MYARPRAPSGIREDAPCPSENIDEDDELPLDVSGPDDALSFDVREVLMALGSDSDSRLTGHSESGHPDWLLS
ncbi:hypothetical protein PI124_g2527 [Phytophthora idaei]|nr:hypothetical protein PI125_g6021 [Phytophthora idaei]KAG3164037.1 hypothetical protein PI126_g5286 [Phytophthora idaei]KAG3252844.1 hypothetical protein PI124_g2527 [Phytophthora idaei]